MAGKDSCCNWLLLLGCRRFFGIAKKQRGIGALMDKSAACDDGARFAGVFGRICGDVNAMFKRLIAQTHRVFGHYIGKRKRTARSNSSMVAAMFGIMV